MRTIKTIHVSPTIWRLFKARVYQKNLKIYEAVDQALAYWLDDTTTDADPLGSGITGTQHAMSPPKGLKNTSNYDTDVALQQAKGSGPQAVQSLYHLRWRANRRKLQGRVYPCCGKVARRLPKQFGELATRTCLDCNRKFVVKRVSTYVEEVGKRTVRYTWRALPDLPGRDAMGARELHARSVPVTYRRAAPLRGSDEGEALDPIYAELIDGPKEEGGALADADALRRRRAESEEAG